MIQSQLDLVIDGPGPPEGASAAAGVSARAWEVSSIGVPAKGVAVATFSPLKDSAAKKTSKARPPLKFLIAIMQAGAKDNFFVMSLKNLRHGRLSAHVECIERTRIRQHRTTRDQ